jgi:hypothetical protein
MVPLAAVLHAAAWSQTMIEYGGLSANSATGISKAAGATAKAADGLGNRLGDAIGNPGPARSAPSAQPGQSSDPDHLMRANRWTLEHGAILHVTCVPQGATLFVDRRAVARTPAELRLPPGKHILELKSPAFLDWSWQVSLSAGEKLSLEPKLQQDKQVQSDKRIINLSF